MLCCEVARTTSNYVLDATNSQLHVACYAINLPKQLPATFLILRASNYVLDATLLTCSENFQVRSQIPTLLLMFLYWLVQTASNYVLDTTLQTEFHSNSLPSQSHNRSLAGSSRRRWNRAGTVVKRKFHQILDYISCPMFKERIRISPRCQRYFRQKTCLYEHSFLSGR